MAHRAFGAATITTKGSSSCDVIHETELLIGDDGSPHLFTECPAVHLQRGWSIVDQLLRSNFTCNYTCCDWRADGHRP